MADAKKALYAVLGSGQVVIDRVKGLWQAYYDFLAKRRKQAEKNYREYAKRGEKIVTSIRRSAPVKRASEQTRTARSRVKGAATSVRKAVEANAEAVQSAAKKVS